MKEEGNKAKHDYINEQNEHSENIPVDNDEVYLLSEEKHMLNENENDWNKEHSPLLNDNEGDSNASYSIHENKVNKEEIQNSLKHNDENINEQDEDNINPIENRTGLLSLSSISRCQMCGIDFDEHPHTPLLMKCNHFFCQDCIERYLTDIEGIKCPVDGYIAKKITELKILYKFILPQEEEVVQNNNIKPISISNPKADNNNISNLSQKSDNAFCPKHPDQKLTHFVEETREVICVYCAFNKIQSNPKLHIKEITEKVNDYIKDLNGIKDHYQKYADVLQGVMNDVKSNKENEEEKVIMLYDTMISYLEKNKNVYLKRIDDLFTENTNIIKNQIDNLENTIENIDTLQNELSSLSGVKLNEAIDKFNLFMRNNNNEKQCEIAINEYRFSHDDENKAMVFLNNFGDLKSKKKIYKKNNDKEKTSIEKMPMYNNNTFLFNDSTLRRNEPNDSILDNTKQRISYSTYSKMNNNNMNNSNTSFKEFNTFSNSDCKNILNKYTFPGKSNENYYMK